MNLDRDISRIREVPKLEIQPPTFERLLHDLKPQLDKLPHEQQLPALPPDQLALESVQEWVRHSGMLVTDTCPPTVAIAGEFLDRGLLREGRVGQHGKFRVSAFLYKFADGSLRTVVIYPRDGIDVRELGKAIFWGQVADVPENVAQSMIHDLKVFFEICTFKLSGIIDLPALERFKNEYEEKAQDKQKDTERWTKATIDRLEASKLKLETITATLEKQCEYHRTRYLAEQHRAEGWKLAGLFGLAIGVPPYAVTLLQKLSSMGVF